MKYDLGFGNSVCVREAFIETYHGNMIIFSSEGLSRFDYPERFGDPELIEITRKVIKRQTGMDKKHIYITNGATGAVTIALRAMKQRGYNICYTREAPWYLRYPSMIKASGLTHLDGNKGIDTKEGVILLDLPSNPVGITSVSIPNSITASMVLDGVYLNKVYTSGYYIPIPAHDVFCGSYSKLLGLNGLRVGWIATNDDLLAERLKELVMAEYCGISVASVEILKNVLFDFDWELFETTAKSYLNYNREQWTKLEKFFGGRPVRYDGMFYYGKIEPKVAKLLRNCGINWTKGSDLGTDDDWGRFNLGQDINTVRKAVNAIIRADRIK